MLGSQGQFHINWTRKALGTCSHTSQWAPCRFAPTPWAACQTICLPPKPCLSSAQPWLLHTNCTRPAAAGPHPGSCPPGTSASPWPGGPGPHSSRCVAGGRGFTCCSPLLPPPSPSTEELFPRNRPLVPKRLGTPAVHSTVITALERSEGRPEQRRTSRTETHGPACGPGPLPSPQERSSTPPPPGASEQWPCAPLLCLRDSPLKPGAPLSPGGPFSPGRPGSPESPRGPGWAPSTSPGRPLSPGGPTGPGRPEVPGSPSRPGGPTAPLEPRGPMNPERKHRACP